MRACGAALLKPSSIDGSALALSAAIKGASGRYRSERPSSDSSTLSHLSTQPHLNPYLRYRPEHGKHYKTKSKRLIELKQPR